MKFPAWVFHLFIVWFLLHLTTWLVRSQGWEIDDAIEMGFMIAIATLIVTGAFMISLLGYKDTVSQLKKRVTETYGPIIEFFKRRKNK